MTSSSILDDLVLTILAGGSGTRLWPVSRAKAPKHLVPILGANTLIQQTLTRNQAIADLTRTIVVGAVQQADLIKRQLGVLAPESINNVILEPTARNTAAAVAIAAFAARAAFGPSAVLFVCPSDHLMSQPQALHCAARAGIVAARAGKLVTFGIEPSRAETGFGWIETGDEISGAKGVLQVARFVEKPELALANQMLEAGTFLWNSGMFLMRADTILAELQRHAPEILSTAEVAYQNRDPVSGILDAELFSHVPSHPIDKAVMEKSAHVAVVPCDPSWSDLGSWHAIWETLDHDEDGNAMQGDAITEKSSGNLVMAQRRLVALAGVDNLAVVETADAVLVAKRDDSEAVKAIVNRLADAKRNEVVAHIEETHDWGEVDTLATNDRLSIKEIRVDPMKEVARKGPAYFVCISGDGIDHQGKKIGNGYFDSLATNDEQIFRNISASNKLIIAEIIHSV